MDTNFLITIGASILLAVMILVPAELQIYKSSVNESDQLHAKRDFHWSQKLLNHLLTVGFSLLVMYIMISNPNILDSFLKAFSLK